MCTVFLQVKNYEKKNKHKLLYCKIILPDTQCLTQAVGTCTSIVWWHLIDCSLVTTFVPRPCLRNWREKAQWNISCRTDYITISRCNDSVTFISAAKSKPREWDKFQQRCRSNPLLPLPSTLDPPHLQYIKWQRTMTEDSTLSMT